MQKFPFVNDQTVLLLDGTAARNEAGGEIVWTQYSWLCGRIGDPEFAAKLSGIEGIAFGLKAQQALSEQKEDAANRGFWLLEDAPAEALLRATKTPQQGYNARFTLTIMVFADAVAAMEPYKPEAAAAP